MQILNKPPYMFAIYLFSGLLFTTSFTALPCLRVPRPDQHLIPSSDSFQISPRATHLNLPKSTFKPAKKHLPGEMKLIFRGRIKLKIFSTPVDSLNHLYSCETVKRQELKGRSRSVPSSVIS